MSLDWYQDVRDFHHKFGCAAGHGEPRGINHDLFMLRKRLIDEEHGELNSSMIVEDLPGVADACADLIYVVIGTAITYGIDLRPVWDAVHAANMAKEGGKKRPDGKILKPEGWTAPDVAGILKAQRRATLR